MPVVVVKPATIGLGLFAAKAFNPRDVIIQITGKVVPYELLWKRGGTFMNNCIRFGPETYLDPGDGVGRYVNHSCEPNTGVQKRHNQLFLVAAEPIRKGAELVFDYSTTIGDDDIWTMRCFCSTPSCRRRIRRFGSLPEELRSRYVERGLVPGCILRTLARN